MRLFEQSFWVAHCWILLHPTVGSPVNPGWHEQSGVWLMVAQMALTPHTPSSWQTSTQAFLTQDVPGEQSLFSTHSKDRHCCRGSPEVRAGQEQTAWWSTTEQMAPVPQARPPWHGSTHL